jgi:DNA-binding transcriptional LysR family regulator
MEVQQLLVFCRTAETLNMTRTGDLLGFSQPAVSKQIQQLEGELGGQLFVRKGRQLQLTPFGEMILPRAQRIVNQIQELKAEAAQAIDPYQGRLVVVAGSVTMTYLLPRVLAMYRKQFPKAQLTVYSGKTTETVRMVEDGTAHVGLVSSEVIHARLTVEPLFYDTMAIVASPELHPHNLAELAQGPWLIFARGTGFRTYIDQFFAQHGFVPENVMEMDSIEALREMAAAGLGYTLLPVRAVNQAIERGRLCIIQQEKFLPPARCNSLIYRKENSFYLKEEFLSLARKILKNQ